MPRHPLSLRNGLGAAVLVVGMGTAACGDERTGGGTSATCRAVVSRQCEDAVVVALETSDERQFYSVGYAITREGTPEFEGLINTAPPGSTATAWVAGLQYDVDYRLEMTATALGNTVVCEAATFRLASGVSEPGRECELPASTGGQRIGDNTCARLKSARVSPLETSHEQLIDVAVEAVDAEGDPVQYRWSASSGDFYYWYQADTRYDCGDADSDTLMIEVSDDQFDRCIDRRAVRVNCVDGSAL